LTEVNLDPLGPMSMQNSAYGRQLTLKVIQYVNMKEYTHQHTELKIILILYFSIVILGN
jgi:hypothetical protein